MEWEKLPFRFRAFPPDAGEMGAPVARSACDAQDVQEDASGWIFCDGIHGIWNGNPAAVPRRSRWRLCCLVCFDLHFWNKLTKPTGRRHDASEGFCGVT